MPLTHCHYARWLPCRHMPYAIHTLLIRCCRAVTPHAYYSDYVITLQDTPIIIADAATHTQYYYASHAYIIAIYCYYMIDTHR